MTRCTSAGGAGDHQVLDVAQPADRADAAAGWIVDPDLRTDVSLGVEGEHPHLPPLRAELEQLLEGHPRLVVVGEHEQTGVDLSEERGQRGDERAARVERAAGRRVATVIPFAGDAVVAGRIPRDQGLPGVVVAVVGMLVVRWVEIREVDGREPGRGGAGIGPDRGPMAGEQHRGPQLERSERPWRPRLEVGHLHARSRVDAVGGLEQAGQQQRPQGVPGGMGRVDPVADGVDPPAVVGVEVPRVLAEGAGDVAVGAGEGGETGQRVVEHRGRDEIADDLFEFRA